jgi:hypothetical protein
LKGEACISFQCVFLCSFLLERFFTMCMFISVCLICKLSINYDVLTFLWALCKVSLSSNIFMIFILPSSWNSPSFGRVMYFELLSCLKQIFVVNSISQFLIPLFTTAVLFEDVFDVWSTW